MISDWYRTKGGAQLGTGPGGVGPFGPYGGGVRDPEDMEIEVLVVPDCPNRHLAEQRLRHALHATGMAGTVVTTRVVAGQAEAERIGFTGSPTILIDGCDPFAPPDAVPSLSCRIYRAPGTVAGAPTVDQLCQALREAVGAAN